MQTIYKGFRIDFNERIGKFNASRGSGETEVEFEDEVYNKLKTTIDKFLCKKHVRMTVLYEKYSYDRESLIFKPWTITSYNPETGEVWLSDGKSGREKTRMDNDFVKDTPENRILAARVLELKEKARALITEAEELEKKFKTWDSAALKAALGYPEEKKGDEDATE